jgi:hypothetical protein
LGAILLTNSVAGQIVGDEIEKKKKKDKEPREKMNRDSLSGTTYYLTYLYNFSGRQFQDNSVFGSYADWEEQVPERANGVSGGIFLPVSGNLSLDIGITLFGHKERYAYDDPNSDSTFAYSQSYMQLGMPIKMRYTYGDQFQVFGFAGFTPLNILHVRYQENYTTALGSAVERDLEKVQDKLSIFNLMGTVGIGLSFNMDWIGITVYPEYRYHFFNSYNSQKPIDHRMRSFGINTGLTLRF